MRGLQLGPQRDFELKCQGSPPPLWAWFPDLNFDLGTFLQLSILSSDFCQNTGRGSPVKISLPGKEEQMENGSEGLLRA